MRYLIACCLVACSPSAPPVAAPRTSAPAVASLGETFTLHSKILGELRVINVYLPPGYATATAERYPVLYMPDGGMNEDFPHVAGSVDVSIKNGVIRPVIVVGVQNTERRRDLPGPTTTPDEIKAAPRAGGADAFRQFFRDELKPHIAKRYRASTESALIGESLAGLFAVETFLVEPSLFDSYIAADPSLQWNEQALVSTANVRLAAFPAGGKQLYVATSGDVPEIVDGAERLATSLRIIAPAGVTWTFEPMPDEHHHTIFPTAALRGIRRVFAL